MNISLPDSTSYGFNTRRLVSVVQSVPHVHIGYPTVLAAGAALVLGLTVLYGTGGRGTNWPLAVVALALLFGGVAAHAIVSVKLRALNATVNGLEQRLSGEASAGRVLAGIKLLAPAASEAHPPGPDARLASAARMATGFSAAVVLNLRDAHAVFVPSSWSYEGSLAQLGEQFEPVDGRTPAALAARQGSAVVLSLTDPGCIGLPTWAERAGFVQGIVTPITRGLDTIGVVYVLNKSNALPALNEIEQLELIVSFASNSTATARFPGETGIANVADSRAGAQPLRLRDERSGRGSVENTGISMPGFVLHPDLERMDLDGVSLSLSPTEFLLMQALASSPGKPVSVEELVNTCWSRDSRPADNAIDVAIFRLRRKLRKTATGKRLIETVRGSGYMFVPPAVPVPVSSGDMVPQMAD